MGTYGKVLLRVMELLLGLFLLVVCGYLVFATCMGLVLVNAGTKQVVSSIIIVTVSGGICAVCLWVAYKALRSAIKGHK